MSHGPILLRDHREDFDRKLPKHGVRTRAVHGICRPLALLGCNVRGRGHPLGWIYQEEDKDLSVTGPGGILQVE